MSSIEETYNKIAKDFDKKRYKVWDRVAEFIDNQPVASKMLEVGSGNGKNMLHRRDLELVGVDLSEEQVLICRKKGLNVEKSNMCNLPFDDLEFDSIICIATYHHLNNDDDRKKSLQEMYRVLKVGGELLLSVWAMEQEESSKRKFSSSDEMVPWKVGDKVELRYYHIYKSGDLEKEILLLSPQFSYKEPFYEQGNWFILLSKDE